MIPQLELRAAAAAFDRGEDDAAIDILCAAIVSSVEEECLAQFAAGASVDTVDLSKLFEREEA